MMVVYLLDPWVKGVISCSTPSWLVCTNSLKPISLAIRSRNWIISRNLKVVSTCISGKGIGPGAKAFWANRNSTEESLPME